MFYLEQVEVASMILCAGIVLVAHTSKLQPEAQLLQAVIDREIVSGGMVDSLADGIDSINFWGNI